MSKRFRDWVRKAEASDEFAAEKAALRAAEEIFRSMERLGISRAELARRLGTSPAYVTKILRGNVNFTLASLARLARALEGELRLHIAPAGNYTRWFDLPLGISAPQPRVTTTVPIRTGWSPASPASGWRTAFLAKKPRRKIEVRPAASIGSLLASPPEVSNADSTSSAAA